ncbi:hypothetical protein K7W03_26905 [Sphingobium sp. PNB]|uniref:hypothetical protein n=1 Tax=Sphingobium sp. PNB TaxID=863934 RepID=UPI001CA3AC54|nr:hypothetical protein [Sphingobium sp. PNB]MCB4863207.1 hypothetical protein [Sphingobium sp. PNB]
MTYRLESSHDGKKWTAVMEQRTRLDCPGSGMRKEPVKRDRLQDIQREAEFHSHRFPHVRIIHPTTP